MSELENLESVVSQKGIEIVLPTQMREISMAGDAKDLTYIIPIAKQLEAILPMQGVVHLSGGRKVEEMSRDVGQPKTVQISDEEFEAFRNRASPFEKKEEEPPLPAFCCRVCGSTSCTPVRNSNGIIGPGGRSWIDHFVCDGCSATFTDIQKFSKPKEADKP